MPQLQLRIDDTHPVCAVLQESRDECQEADSMKTFYTRILKIAQWSFWEKLDYSLWYEQPNSIRLLINP